MPSAAPVTPLLHDRGASSRIDSLLWLEGREQVLAADWSRRAEPDVGLPFGELMTMPSTPAATAQPMRDLITSGGEIEDLAVVVAGRLLVDLPRRERDFAELFQELRGRLRLPVQKYAVLLGTSRRTLYHWLETGRAQEQALWRLERLSEWLAEIEDRLSPADVQRLMDPELPDSIAATLIAQGDEAAAERLRQLVAHSDPPRRARRLPELADERAAVESPTLGDQEFRSALSTFAAPRDAVRATAGWTPRELTDAPPDDTP